MQLRDGTITASNGGVVFSKMLQASCGWVYGEGEKSRQIFPMYEEGEKNPRIDALLDIIKSAERKVIVFSPFKSATAGISAALKAAGIDFAEVTGDTPHGERTKIFSAFQGGEKFRVLNGPPGVHVARADTDGSRHHRLVRAGHQIGDLRAGQRPHHPCRAGAQAAGHPSWSARRSRRWSTSGSPTSTSFRKTSWTSWLNSQGTESEMSNLSGYQGEWEIVEETCPECGNEDCLRQEWTPSDGGEDEYHYECQECGSTWWKPISKGKAE